MLKLFSAGTVFSTLLIVVAFYSDQASAVLDSSLEHQTSESLCKDWSEAEGWGTLPAEYVNESSGLAVSGGGQHLYHTNDSGDSARVFETDMQGRAFREIRIANFEPRDVEALAWGKCSASSGVKQQCLFVGDIGDNKRKRSHIRVLAIRESLLQNPIVTPLKNLTLRYPDGAHNAEALAMHPNGDMIIVTKETFNSYRVAKAARVYRVAFEDWMNSRGEALTLDFVGTIDIPAINSELNPAFQVVTGMSIHPSGHKFLLLTYANAIEFAVDFSQSSISFSELKEGRDYGKVSLEVQEQQEAITYLPTRRDSFIYSTEMEDWDWGDEAPMLRVACQQ